MIHKIIASLLIVMLGIVGYGLVCVFNIGLSQGIPMDLFLTALIGLTSLVGTVVITAALRIFGPGVARRAACWVRGHAFRPTAYGSSGRCARCGEER